MGARWYDARKDMRRKLADQLRSFGLEPLPDGRSILDDKRPMEQHIGMIIAMLKARTQSIQRPPIGLPGTPSEHWIDRANREEWCRRMDAQEAPRSAPLEYDRERWERKWFDEYLSMAKDAGCNPDADMCDEVQRVLFQRDAERGELEGASGPTYRNGIGWVPRNKHIMAVRNPYGGGSITLFWGKQS
jgi:hypothetical protein